MGFQQTPLEKAYFMVKMTGPAKVQLASSDHWKAPLVNPLSPKSDLVGDNLPGPLPIEQALKCYSSRSKISLTIRWDSSPVYMYVCTSRLIMVKFLEG